MDTVDIIARLRASDVDVATLDALRITADRLCCEYAYMPADQLLLEGKAWLARVVGLQHQRVSLAQHRDIIALAGKLSLLVGCVEYDSGRPRDAEATRQAALMLGQESGELSVQGWAHEMRAWFSLTRGDYRGVIAASEAGIAVAPNESVAVQLYAQKAKAWARLGDRTQTEVALDQGRQLLERLPYPENIEDHFVVDPAKWDFYRMDALRKVGENRLAEQLAREVIRAGTDFDGTERSPMRIAEARSRWAWSRPAKETWTPRWPSASGLSQVAGDRCRRWRWCPPISVRLCSPNTRTRPRPRRSSLTSANCGVASEAERDSVRGERFSRTEIRSCIFRSYNDHGRCGYVRLGPLAAGRRSAERPARGPAVSAGVREAAPRGRPHSAGRRGRRGREEGRGHTLGVGPDQPSAPAPGELLASPQGPRRTLSRGRESG